jgi:alkanesulfonate monooxygenase SsuD/methylene tetrahydromethanopterin reductase-like flavin-dependent oxidoreductase (luciferase family)
VWRWTVTAGVEVARRLWDSWEDDAVIRDVATGRFVDRDKLHYIDFVGRYFSVKGPSITPRPPQGQPVVAALAHAKPVYGFAARSTDLVFITPSDDGSLKSTSRR